MTKVMEPSKTGKIKKLHSYCMLLPVSKINKGLAPAGGCTHRSNCITAMAHPTESAMVNIEIPKNFKKSKPMNAEIKCPKIIFLGWARGDCDAA